MVFHAHGQRRSQLVLLVLALVFGLAVAGLWSTTEARLLPRVRSSAARLRSSQELATHRHLQEEGEAEPGAAETEPAGEEAGTPKEDAPESDGEIVKEKAAAAGADGDAGAEGSAEEEAPRKEPVPGQAEGEEVAAVDGEAAPAKEATPGAADADGEPTEVSSEPENGPEAKAGAEKEGDDASGPKGPADASDTEEADATAAGKDTEKASAALSPAGAGMVVVGHGDEEGPSEVPPELVAVAVVNATGAEEVAKGAAGLTAGAEGETTEAEGGEAAPGADDLPAPVKVNKSKKKRFRKRGPQRKRKPVPKVAAAGTGLGSEAEPEGAASEGAGAEGAASETGTPAEPTGDAEEPTLKPKGEESGATDDAGAPVLETTAAEEGAEKGTDEEAGVKDLTASKAEEAPETVEAAAEDSGNSGVAQEMALGDAAGAAEGAGAGKPEMEEAAGAGVGDVPIPPVLAGVGAPEQLMIEQAALEDEEDYASFMSELFSAGQRITPAMQALKEKTAKHVVPTVQEFARSSHEAFRKTTDKFQTHMTPLFGPSASPVLATVLSFSLLLLPLLLVGGLVYQFRFILTLQRLLVLCNLYLCLYCFALLAACVIISSEPMRSLQAAAEPNFYVLQILEAGAYVVYLGLQLWFLVTVSRAKGKDRDAILIAKAALASIVALGIGLHYYIFVFERALLDKPPKISAWAYFVYTALFGLLTVLGRPKEVKQDVGKDT